MSNQVMLVMVNATDNNNKFYELTELPNGSVQARYGRIGGSETTRTYPAGSFHAKKNEKIRKGMTCGNRRGTPWNVYPIRAVMRHNDIHISRTYRTRHIVR